MEMGEFFTENFRITGSSRVVTFLPCNMNSDVFVLTGNGKQSSLPILWCNIPVDIFRKKEMIST